MRKILLAATAAACAGGMATTASAQPVPLTNGASGQFAPGTASPGFTADPGTIQAFWRGRLYFDAAVKSDSYDRTGFGKQNQYVLGAAARIFPSFEGTAANGLKYGAFVEVRQNAGGTGPSGNTGGNTLIFRRESGWVGGSWGQLRFGQTDDVLGLFMTGTFEGFGDSWNGDLPALLSSQTVVNWPFAENSGTYGSLKFVYLSPQFAGFDAGISFAPSNATSGYPSVSGTAGGAGVNSSSIGALSGSFTGNLANLRRENNLITTAIRYRGSFGPVGIAATAGLAYGGNVKNGGLSGTAANPTGLGPTGQYSFRNPFAFDSGVQITYGGLAVGGHVVTGAINPNGSNNLLPVAKGVGNSTAFVFGASYATGPFIVGASYVQLVSPGAYNMDYAPVAGVGNLGKRREWGIAVGGTYAYSTGATLSLTYLYGERKQNNYNFLADARSTANNKTRAQGLILTNFFQW